MNAASDLQVSVIIPSHNRVVSLRRTLDALGAQTYPAECMEVIVVADGCRDATSAMVRNYRSKYALRLVELDGAGAAAARNRGAAEASGQLLVFLDDDIEPAPELVAAHARAHATGYAGMSLGPSLPALGTRLDFFRMELRAWWTDFFGAMRRPGYRFTYYSLAAGNCAIERALFVRSGGFDPTIRSSGGEDWEFGLRLLKAGVPFTYVDSAQARHFDASDLAHSLRRKRQEGRADAIIGRRHPDLLPSLRLASFERPHSKLGRIFRHLAFAAPRAGDAAAEGLRQLMRLLEYAHLRRPWRRLLGRVNDYWYWRGVADQFASRAALAAFLDNDMPRSEAGPEIELDLADGIRLAEHRLDELRPAGAVLLYRGQHVGRIPAEAGAEPLLGCHLRAILATVLSDRLLRVLAVQAASGSLLHPEWRPLTELRARSG